MKFLQLIVLLTSGVSAVFATCHMPNGKVVSFQRFSQSLKQSLVEEAQALGVNVFGCPLSENDIQSIDNILTDAIAYLYGALDASNNDPEAMAQTKEELIKKNKNLILSSSYVDCCAKMENSLIENVLHNLIFLKNTVVCNLEHQDENIRNQAYGQLVREIAGVQKWFELDICFETFDKNKAFPWLKTVSVIFSDLHEYFPPKTIGFAGMSSAVSRGTRIDQIDSAYTNYAREFHMIIDGYKEDDIRKITPDTMEAYFRANLSRPLRRSYKKLQDSVHPLLLPFFSSRKIKTAHPVDAQIPGLRRRVKPVRYSAAPAEKVSDKTMGTAEPAIRSGIENVFGLSKEFVSLFQAKE